MARVTKINVGGTNYDIAHEGELKNSGFEVVTSLPTTGLFEGREVVYQGVKYVYKNGWISQYNPVNLPRGVTLQSSTEALTNAATVIELADAELCQIPELLNKSLFISNNTNVVKQSDRLYELIDNETGDITVVSGIVQPVLGQTLRYTAINPSYSINSLHSNIVKHGSAHKLYCIYIPQQYRAGKAIYKIEYYTYTNVTGDGDYNNKANYEWKTVFEKELKQYSEIIYPFAATVYLPISPYGYIHNARVSITPTSIDVNKINIREIDILYFGENHVSPAYANRLINFDAVIEPTQTSTEFKSPLWLWQYLIQGVNWLKAKCNTKLDKRSYNHVYTNCGYMNMTPTTGALIIELPFAPNGDTNNSMTYIELNVYSHRKGCSKYIIALYSYAVNSYYEWSAYSYMGYNYFSSIAQARRTDNNNIVIVLGNFTDVHKNEHFSISRIVTGFNRNNDDTDQFQIYTDSTSSNYTALKDSSYIPQVISYNDLTDTPTLAPVATSGDYNDLLNRPTFSGSYNDLTDKPTLFSGSYEDLTNKPNLATVATSGSYNDLTDKPTLFSGSYDDLTNKPNLATVATSGSYNDLTNTPALVFQNIGGTISSVQIPDGLIANAKLANPSMSLNGITVNLGDTSILPWYVDYNEVDYPARIREHWLQIYRNGVWANLMYLGDILPTQVGQITSLDDLSWYNEQVSEYEVDSNTTTSILNGTTSPAALLLSCTAEQLTLNLFPISGKTYGKGSLDSLITNLQGKEFSVFVENDLDTILASGNDYLVRIKISKVPTPKAIIECYIAR